MKRIILGIAVAGALLSAGIVANPSGAAPQPVSAPAATGAKCQLKTPLASAYCDSVVMGTLQKPTNLDPTKPRAVTDYQIAYPMQGLLWRFDADLVPRMDLLKSEVVSKDGLTITQTLKPGMKYSDGTPVVAQDIVTSFTRWRASNVSSSYIAKVTGVTAPNATTAVWKLSSPFPDFPYVMASQFLFINPTGPLTADPVGYWKNPVSAGPMKLQSWTPGSDTMVLVANPNYWAKSKVGKLTFQAIPDAASRLLNLTQGSVDYVFDLAYTGVGAIDKSKVRVYGHPMPGTYTLTSNAATKGPLKDVYARQAISAAIDRQKVAKVAFFGTVAPSCANTFRKGNPYFLCALPNQGRQDLDLAKKLLAKSGTPNGFSFDLTVWARPAWPEAAQIIAQDLAKIGIKANIVVKQDTVAIQDLTSGNFEMQFSGNNGPTPIIQMLNWYAPGGAWTVWGRVDDPSITATLNAAASAKSAGAVRALLLKANQQAYGNSIHIPVADRAVISATRLPKGIMEATSPGEWLTVATTPALTAQKAPPGIG